MSQEEQKTHTISGLDSETPQSGEVSALSDQREPEQASELEKLLTAKADECNALNDKFLRLAAEFENYKRLSLREQRDQVRYGNEQILKELLPVVDNLERAIQSAKDSQSQDALIQGVNLTLKQLTGALTKFGVRPVTSVGQLFDPKCHQAVSQVESAIVPENMIVEEFQKGYLLHDRILRAAMVSVSTGQAQGAIDGSTLPDGDRPQAERES